MTIYTIFNRRNSSTIRTLLFVGFVFSNSTIFAQKNKAMIDSLEKLIELQKDTNLVKTYNELTWQYRNVSKEKAIEYGTKAIELGAKLGFNKGVAQGYNDLGIIYYDKMDYKQALEQYGKSKTIREKIGDKKGVAAIYNKIGVLYQRKGEFINALENQQKALKIYEEIKYDYGLSYALNNIAILNFDIGNNEEALKYNFRSAEIKKKIGDSLGLSGSFVNIANIYFKKKEYQKAIEYNSNALELCRNTGDKEYISATLNNLSSVYSKVNDLANALKCVDESYQLRKQLDDKKSMISCLVNMSHIYLKQNRQQICLDKLNEALLLSKSVSALTEMQALYSAFTDYYESIGDYKKALESDKLQFVFHESVLNVDVNSKFAEMNAKYENEKSQKEIIEKNLKLKANDYELADQKTQRNILLISLIIFIFLSYLIYSRYRFKQKIELNTELMHQQELRTKAVIEAEENERTRIARELHDGLGQQLSAVKLNMSSLESSLEFENDDQRRMLQNALEIIDESVKEVRAVSHSMMPNALVKSGLKEAIKEFVNRLGKTDHLKFDLQISGLNERLNTTIETIVFRVLQEIVNNILKHSKATIVTIQIIKDIEELTIIVEDNGVGFDVNTAKSDGIGLKNLQSRIEYLHGTVNIDSHLQKGTTIIIELPIK